MDFLIFTGCASQYGTHDSQCEKAGSVMAQGGLAVSMCADAPTDGSEHMVRPKSTPRPHSFTCKSSPSVIESAELSTTLIQSIQVA